MVDIKTLLPELKKLVTELSEDLLARSTASAEIDTGLREAYTQIEKGGRTADAFEVWREDYLDQVAVAWVLGCVFVRFMEDNQLIDECWLAGEGERRKLAEDTHELYFREHPRESDREYFEHVFHEVGKIPACHDLFAEGKTPLWAVGPSGDAAMKLLAFWREIDTDSGHLKRTFDVENGDTRFVGDLYQDLSERARKKYALLQTPVFVEEFILDRTLDPAINEFGLDEVRMIDPTCGSGHFLLGGFARLFDLWIKREDNEVVAAQKALDGVWGVDVNPFAVAIARFRLIVAALRACGISSLKKAPAWNIHLAIGDSLLFGSRWDRDGKKKGEQQFFATDEESWAPEIYACEDKYAISEVLGKQYHAVVGNPPYITVKDKGLNQAYRNRYRTCHRQYSLGVPFTERFFDLAQTSSNEASGFVGMITANSFMKREFGTKLVEEFLPLVDLTHVIDTSGAYIPGHGTPTVIMFGRNRTPVTNHVRAVLGIQGEPTTPDDAAQGQVWQSIIQQVDVDNSEDAFTSVSDVERSILTKHPWSLQGGGASGLKKRVDDGALETLNTIGCDVGYLVITGEDNCLVVERTAIDRLKLSMTKAIAIGENLRDWSIATDQDVLWPNSETGEKLSEGDLRDHLRFLWPYRSSLRHRKAFGVPVERKGIPWWALRELYSARLKTPLTLAFPFVASHNHFILDRATCVFNRSAPVIKLADGSSEDDYIAMLGYLNSSLVCFWMKQVSQQKQMTGGDGVRVQSRAKVPYEFAVTQLKNLPIPNALLKGDVRNKILKLAKELESLGRSADALTAESAILQGLDEGHDSILHLFDRFVQERSHIRSKQIVLQEEIDFTVYSMFGVVDSDLLAANVDELISISVEGMDAGCRPFNMIQQRSLDGFGVPSEIPREWPRPLSELWVTRIEAIRNSKELRLVEDDHYKRRWIGRQGLFNHTARQSELGEACKKYLLKKLEGMEYWPAQGVRSANLQTAAELATTAASDDEFMTVASVLRGRQDFDIAELVEELVSSESVPFLPCLRYKPSGIRKHMVWRAIWDRQRQQDENEDQSDMGKAPPKFTAADYLKSDYMRLRGPLDVPKERWISFPNCERDSDPSMVVGWSGWNHLQQGTAIVAYYDARKNEGWTPERLTPLLAALDQLLPWIHQWHPEIDPEYNETAGTSFQTLLDSEAQELGLTLEQIRNWTPPAKKKATKKKAAKKPRKKSKSAGETEGE